MDPASLKTLVVDITVMRRWIMRTCLLSALFVLWMKDSGQAQSVELKLHEGMTDKPIPGAIVRLLRNDTVVAQVLSSELGRAVLRANQPGTYRLRIDRIGFSGFLTDPFELGRGMTFRAELPIPSNPVLLPQVDVRSSSPCAANNTYGALAAVLWEEIRKALTATLLTQEARSVPLLVREFEREVNRSGKVLREWVFRLAVTHGQPFASLPSHQLLRTGFVFSERDTMVFAAPEARLLLSDEFVATHCFRAVPGPANRIGLAFEPVPDRSLPDVSGTLWVNRLTGELQELEFEYTGLGRELTRLSLGGRVEFQRISSGSWIISYWHVRMPLLESFERYRSRQSAQEITRVVSLIDRGGRAGVVSGTTRIGRRAVVMGLVYDSTLTAGLAGAVVTIQGSTDSAVSGHDGVFALDVAAFGPHLVRVSHPKILASGSTAEREAVLSLGDTTRVEFAVPPVAALVRSRCGPQGKRAGLIGAAWVGEGLPDREAEIFANWRTAMGSIRTERARADDRGGYAFCDLPPDQPVTIQLRRGRALQGETTIKLGWAEFRWLDLWFGKRPEESENRVVADLIAGKGVLP